MKDLEVGTESNKTNQKAKEEIKKKKKMIDKPLINGEG